MRFINSCELNRTAIVLLQDENFNDFNKLKFRLGRIGLIIFL